jgi:hypothetical protein
MKQMCPTEENASHSSRIFKHPPHGPNFQGWYGGVGLQFAVRRCRTGCGLARYATISPAHRRERVRMPARGNARDDRVASFNDTSLPQCDARRYSPAIEYSQLLANWRKLEEASWACQRGGE